MSKTFQVSNGDLFIDPNSGRLVTVVDEVKLSQDIANALMLDLDPSRDYGSELNSLQDPRNSVSQAYVSQLVSEALGRLMAGQRSDKAASASEIIQDILAIRVARDPDHKSDIYFYILVRNNRTQQVEQVVIVTQPTKLNQQLYDQATVDLANSVALQGLVPNG